MNVFQTVGSLLYPLINATQLRSVGSYNSGVVLCAFPRLDFLSVVSSFNLAQYASESESCFSADLSNTMA